MNITNRFYVALGALGFSALGVFCSAPAAAQSATVEYALKYCRSIPDAAERAQCYDAVIDETSAKKAPAAAGRDAHAADEPRNPAPAPVVAPAQDKPAAPAGKEKKTGGFLGVFGGKKDRNGEIKSTIARIDKTSRGGVIFVLEDGSRWRQTDATELYLRPRAGQSMNLTRTSFGNYLCQYDASEIFHCAPAGEDE